MTYQMFNVLKACNTDFLFVDELCGTPKSVENGDFVYCSESGKSTVIYTCHYGFQLQGEEQLTCTSKGWNFEAPVCIGIYFFFYL